MTTTRKPRKTPPVDVARVKDFRCARIILSCIETMHMNRSKLDRRTPPQVLGANVDLDNVGALGGVELGVGEVRAEHEQHVAVSEPVMCASAPAANAATSSWRTCTQSILPLRRIASARPFRLSPTTRYMRLTSAATRTSMN